MNTMRFELASGVIPFLSCVGIYLCSTVIGSGQRVTSAATPLEKTYSVIVGKVRVQLLSRSLVRLESKGAEGFENRVTFHIVNRHWPGVSFTTTYVAGEVLIHTANYEVRVPQNADSLKGVRIESPAGQMLYRYDGKLENSRWLPGPEDKPEVWSFADTPRIIPPPWGIDACPGRFAVAEDQRLGTG
ncbi:MAG TPA: hypothetical protein VKA67_10835 [Verrucomicrobiae bacterium]|nr:hypothetical protein [Verrucomicrobiae bacterium]